MARTVSQIAQQAIGELHVAVITLTARVEALVEENETLHREIEKIRSGTTVTVS